MKLLISRGRRTVVGRSEVNLPRDANVLSEITSKHYCDSGHMLINAKL